MEHQQLCRKSSGGAGRLLLQVRYLLGVVQSHVLLSLKSIASNNISILAPGLYYNGTYLLIVYNMLHLKINSHIVSLVSLATDEHVISHNISARTRVSAYMQSINQITHANSSGHDIRRFWRR